VPEQADPNPHGNYSTTPRPPGATPANNVPGVTTPRNAVPCAREYEEMRDVARWSAAAIPWWAGR
jgi:hypothetical protein